MTQMTRDDAARALGMKPREVITWDGAARVALLHDGTRFAFGADSLFTELPRLAASTPVAAEPLERPVEEQGRAADVAMPLDGPAEAGAEAVKAIGEYEQRSGGNGGVSAPVEPEPVLPPDVAAGTVAQVLEWAGRDPGRARLALTAERQRETPRSTLVASLEAIAGTES